MRLGQAQYQPQGRYTLLPYNNTAYLTYLKVNNFSRFYNRARTNAEIIQLFHEGGW
jgi:hypothetical protein